MTEDVTSTSLYQKTLGCLLGGIIGDAMGEPSEGKSYQDIERDFGWTDSFDGGGTDDTILRDLLAEALIRTGGYATRDDWAQVWLDHWDTIFGPKVGKFFISVLHTARKVRIQGVPRMAALGSIPCSSSAMCMAPAGIVNACNPRQAAIQAYNLASLINVHDAGFCQDGAASIAAAVAEALSPGATVDSVLESSVGFLESISGTSMTKAIGRAVDAAREYGDYRKFRSFVYENAGSFLQPVKMNSLETVPITLALFYLADADVEMCVTYAANFGRDTDTMAAMAGAMAGALRGVHGIRPEWVEKANRYASLSQEEMAANLVRVAVAKCETEKKAQLRLESISRPDADP